MRSVLPISYLIGSIWTVAVLLGEVQGRANFNLLPKNCGMSVTDRVSHGNATFVYEHPWVAVIRYTEKEKILDRCAGSLINERYVLTAAHCIRNLKLHSVILGEHTKSQERDCSEFYDTTGSLTEIYCADAVEEFGIESFEYHAEFNRPRFRNDIGLLRLNRSVIMNDHIQPICLPVTAKLRRLTSSNFIAVGWGRTKNDAALDVLTGVIQLRVDNEACQEIYDRSWVNVQLGSKQMCAGSENGVNPCKGFGGGPLGFFAHHDGTRFVQVGIVSFGLDRCESNVPGVYTLVSEYMDWILAKIQPLS
ncbi:serine protease grass-like [Aedes albopictus]|uniref:Peptidase S1 domain-containing protein n=1 Tax=Aedes albopictus TaxID=7160 RepID=A0ABM1YJX1_AEDAL